MASKKEKKPKGQKPKKHVRSEAPVTVAIGWLEADSPKDAKAYARGYIQQRFMAHEESWYSVLRFQGGFLWEAHQGGDGKGYIKSAAKALEEDPGGEHWFRCGDRAYRVIMQDGKPFPHQMPADRSVELLNSGKPQLDRNYSMLPYIKKGTGWLASGAIMAGSSAVFFIGSLVFYGLAYNPGPSVRGIDIAALPHTKWNMVSNVGIEEIVQKLQMQNRGQWSVDKRAHKIEGLNKLRRQRADLERANRERDAIEETARKEVIKAADEADEAALKKTLDEALKSSGETEGAAPAGNTAEPTASNSAEIPVSVPVQTAPEALPPQSQENTEAGQ